MPDTEFWTTAQVLDYLRVSRTTLTRMRANGRLQAVSVTGTRSLRYRRDDVEALVTLR